MSQSSMDKDKTFAKMLLYVNVNETEGPAGQTYTQVPTLYNNYGCCYNAPLEQDRRRGFRFVVSVKVDFKFQTSIIRVVDFKSCQ